MLKSYLDNFPTAIGFALLLIFVLPLSWLSNTVVSSGTLMIGYGFTKAPLAEAILLLVFSIAFLFFYSVLVSLIVLAVRRDLGPVKTNYYLREKIHKFALKYFTFLAAFTIVAAIMAALLVEAGIPVIAVNVLIFLVSASFLFLPQSIVVDEEGLGASILTNWEFIGKNFLVFTVLLLAGTGTIIALQLLEFLFDVFFGGGNFLALLIAMAFIVPFFEVLKTYIYMNRFSIIASYESRPAAAKQQGNHLKAIPQL